MSYIKKFKNHKFHTTRQQKFSLNNEYCKRKYGEDLYLSTYFDSV